MEESGAKCAYCGDQANQRCTGCLVTFYCSKDHQKQHWKKHKHQCCAFKVCQCGTLGRYIVATRDLKPGELILKEKPLVIAPGTFTEPMCLGCFEPLKNNKTRCEQCDWPLCGSNCQGSPHHDAECLFMRRKRNSQQFNAFCNKQSALILQIVAILKCLYLKVKDPDKYNRLMSLESHDHERKKSIRYQTDVLLVRTLRALFAIDDVGSEHNVRFNDDELLKILGIMTVNSHEVPVTTLPLQAIYDSASMVEHSCVNNASKHFDADSNIQIRAAIAIKKGERISIMYSDPMWGTASRQSHLMETKYFQCVCDRCRDSTELKTNFSSVRCPNCTNNGYLSPRSPLQASGDWMCDGCRSREPANYVNAVIKSIGEEIVQLERGSSEACMNFLKKHSQNLHPNHFFLMDVKLALCQMMGKTSSGAVKNLDEKELLTKQKLCMELLEVVNVISPGREVQKYLSECIEIFSYEPPCIPEGQLAAIARLDLVEIETYMDSLEAQEQKRSKKVANEVQNNLEEVEQGLSNV